MARKSKKSESSGGTATAEIIDVMISFDTTGSMYPCLTQVRREVGSLVKRLFKDIPDLRIGIIAHGDYCDDPKNRGYYGAKGYVTKMFDLSRDEKKICKFVQDVGPTGGGDAPECYELVLHEARTLASWETGRQKVLVMIGDDVPHGPSYHANTKKIDWRNELGLLLEAGVNVYAVQALGRRHATSFYKEIAQKTGGFHLKLDQFSHIGDMIKAICYKQQGEESLLMFEGHLIEKGRMNRSMSEVMGTLLGREATVTYDSKHASGLAPVPPFRFQVLEVDDDCAIKDFVEENGAAFKKGRGFYQFTKSVKIQDHKEVILQDNETGDMFSGAEAREILGLPAHGTVTVSPRTCPALSGYTAFVQSTSNNRKLLSGTKFLYEVEDWDR